MLNLKKVEAEWQRFPRLVQLWGDGGFSGEPFVQWVMDTFRVIFEVVFRFEGSKGFVLCPKRWVVERAALVVSM